MSLNENYSFPISHFYFFKLKEDDKTHHGDWDSSMAVFVTQSLNCCGHDFSLILMDTYALNTYLSEKMFEPNYPWNTEIAGVYAFVRVILIMCACFCVYVFWCWG